MNSNNCTTVLRDGEVTRRQFACATAAGSAAALALGAMGVASVSPADAEEAAGTVAAGSTVMPTTGGYDTASAEGLVPDISASTVYIPRNDELPTPKVPAPEQTAYACDVLVVGGGLAGLNAAYAAAEAGASVILADKGTPGYSGLSAWPSCTAYYDPELDADRDLWDRYMLNSCDCFANLTWEDVWCDESKATFDRLTEWGWISTYDRGADTEYWVDGILWHDDVKGYFNHFADHDRRKVFGKVLDEAGVTVLDHVMIVDVVEDQGRCVGAVGMHYQSETPITISAKATILCTGNGVIKSSGYPVGADTFDGIWMGYQHGLPITGVEFEDFHMTTRYAPSNCLMHNTWQYVENIWPTGGTVTEDNLIKSPGVKERTSFYLDGVKRGRDSLDSMDGGESGAACSAACKAGNTDDLRKGKWTSPNPKGHVYGAAPGMCSHLAAGIWCGTQDTKCETGIPGLYAAGDGTNGCYVGGPNYGCQRGSTSSFISMQGYHAGQAAAEYIGGVDATELPAETVQSLTEEMLAPLSVEQGYTPNWIRETLYGIITPGWVTVAKSEASLNAALTQVVMLRDLVEGKIMAENGHDLRMAQEVRHQLLAMELKLRAGLERKETRGYHYRTDYPFRDDAYLYYITQTKGEDGQPVLGRAELEDRWKGDLSADYATRYPALSTPEEVALYGESK